MDEKAKIAIGIVAAGGGIAALWFAGKYKEFEEQAMTATPPPTPAEPGLNTDPTGETTIVDGEEVYTPTTNVLDNDLMTTLWYKAVGQMYLNQNMAYPKSTWETTNLPGWTRRTFNLRLFGTENPAFVAQCKGTWLYVAGIAGTSGSIEMAVNLVTYTHADARDTYKMDFRVRSPTSLQGWGAVVTFTMDDAGLTTYP